MLTRDQIVSVVETYVELVSAHRTEDLVQLFAPDAVQHEPVGVRTNRGHDEIRKYFDETKDSGFTVTLLTPITVVGNFAAMQIRIRLDGVPDFASTDLFEFDDECKIVSITALPDVKAVID